MVTSRFKEMLRILRFAITGGIASAVYAIVAILAVDLFALSGLFASIIGYTIAIPVSFFGQKFWTFRATGSMARELPRFLLVQLLNMAAAAAIMAVLVDLLGLDRLIGVAAVVLAIPAMTYLLLARKVFVQRTDA